MSYDHSCLVTVIKNTSGGPLVCSFIPPHGRALEADEEVEIVGDIIEAIRHMHRTASQRMIQSFLDALDSGDLTIVSTPAPLLEDTVTGDTKAVKVTSGTLGVEDPCWETSISE